MLTKKPKNENKKTTKKTQNPENLLFWFLKVLSVHKHLWNNLSLKNFHGVFQATPRSKQQSAYLAFCHAKHLGMKIFHVSFQAVLHPVWFYRCLILVKLTRLTYMSQVTSQLSFGKTVFVSNICARYFAFLKQSKKYLSSYFIEIRRLIYVDLIFQIF